MGSVKRGKGFGGLFVFFPLFFSITTISSFGQTTQSFRNHEEIEVTGGMKVEILKCTGEGPTEICDCIYFKDKRQNGVRMKQNANQLKDEERAALIAKGIKNPPTRTNGSSTAGATDLRADKSIPASLTPKPKPPSSQKILADAARKADSVAKASSQKMQEALAKNTPDVDSADMDRVFIPSANATSEKKPEASAPATASATTASATTASATTASATATPATTTSPTTPPATTTTDNNLAVKPIARDTAVPVNVPVAKTSIGKDNETGLAKEVSEVKNSPATSSPVASNNDHKSDPIPTPTPPLAKQNNEAAAQHAIDTAAKASADSTETGWVKQYEHVKSVTDNAGKEVNTSAGEIKQAEPSSKSSAEKEPGRSSSVSNSSSATTEPVVGHNDPVVSTTIINGNTKSIENETSSNLKADASTDKSVIGRSAEVNTKGEWEKVTIIDKETEFLYKVHYKGTSSDKDEWVSVTQIRNIDSTPPPVNKPNSDKPVTAPKVNANCSFEAPAPPVYNGDKFSEKLAKRKIYEHYMASDKGSGKKTGVTFLSLVQENPYVNTVSISAANKLEVKFSFAPTGAMIYPVKTQYKVCEQVLGKTSSKTLNSNFACFRNKEGAWTCAILD